MPPLLLSAALLLTGCAPEEKTLLCTVGTMAETAKREGITKTALILVGDVVGQKSYDRSRLYDPEFTTGYRRGRE